MNNIIALQWIQIALFMLTVAIATYSIVLANKSLREARQARQDMFLPTVICKPASSRFIGQYVWFYMQNVGHGIALSPEYCITGIAEVGVVKGYLTDGMNIAQVKPLDFLDHRISQGFHHLAFKLEHVDSNTLLNSQLQLEITYNDVFRRKIKTIYALKYVKEEQHHVFRLDNLQVQLPSQTSKVQKS